jgi:hypothetical protein
MDDGFDPQLADRFRALERVSVPATWSPGGSGTVTAMRSARRGRVVVFAAAAAVVTVALVGVAVFTRDRGASVAGPSSTASTTVAPVGSSSTVSTEPMVSLPEIDWQTVRPEGSIASSNVDAVVSGPAGFVATGVGLADGKNWGRVWHSTDGLTWTESAVDLFGARWVSTPVATTTAYFVIAGPNTDRADAPADTSLFRSVDGETWQPIGPADGLQLLGVAGDRLVAVATGAPQGFSSDTSGPSTTAPMPATGLKVSSDGITWASAAFPDGLPEFTTFGWVVAAGGRFYLDGLADDRVVWESTDGLEWHHLPALPAQGVLATLGDAPAIVDNPDLVPCHLALGLPIGPGVPGDNGAIDEYIEAMWQCGGPASIWRWDGTDWVIVTEAGPGPSPQFGTVLPFSGRLVAPVITPERTLSVATSVDGVAWVTSDVQAPLPGAGGTPQTAIAAASADVAVFITPGGMGEFTNLLVGTTVRESTPQPTTGLLAIGEFVMNGAITELHDAGFVVDAKEGRGRRA